jgi:dGTPase
VSNLGQLLATRITRKLLALDMIDAELMPCFAAIVENAGLLHDVGNPPFGHLGERAMRDWFLNNWEALAKKAGIETRSETPSACKMRDFALDFTCFDGNPQGIRIASNVLIDSPGLNMNLTVPTLLSMIKYPCVAGENPSGKMKCGYFHTEKDDVEEACGMIGLRPGQRYPLSYIMEAADDISYWLSVVGDGLEKQMLLLPTLVAEVRDTWHELYGDMPLPVRLPQGEENCFNIHVAIRWSNYIADEIAERYIAFQDKILSGEMTELLDETTDSGKLLNTLRHIARKHLYFSNEVVHVELSGLKALSTLLDNYGKLLSLNKESFIHVLTDDSSSTQAKHSIAARVCNTINERFVRTYKALVCTWARKIDPCAGELAECAAILPNEDEWLLRAHMVIDCISGMTDDYAFGLYQIFEGIRYTM